MTTPLRLIRPRGEGMPSANGASGLLILRNRVKDQITRLFDRIGWPGAVRPARHVDPLTGQTVEVRVVRCSTVISVNGRDYCFDRLTGRFLGTGTPRLPHWPGAER